MTQSPVHVPAKKRKIGDIKWLSESIDRSEAARKELIEIQSREPYKFQGFLRKVFGGYLKDAK